MFKKKLLLKHQTRVPTQTYTNSAGPNSLHIAVFPRLNVMCFTRAINLIAEISRDVNAVCNCFVLLTLTVYVCSLLATLYAQFVLRA